MAGRSSGEFSLTAATAAMVAVGGVLWVIAHLLAPVSVPLVIVAYLLVMVLVIRRLILGRSNGK